MIAALLTCAVGALIVLAIVQDHNRRKAERLLREQQVRIESLEETNKAMRVKPSRYEVRA